MDGGKHKWLLVMHDEKEFLKKLIYPMSGTVFYNPQAQRKSQARKRKIQDAETEVPAAADEVAETMAVGGSREKYFIDDLVAAVPPYS